MNLRSYLDLLPHGDIRKFAQRLCISSVYLQQLAARLDGRRPSPGLCRRIERETDGAVTLAELRPEDWMEIWPEIAESQSAASVPA